MRTSCALRSEGALGWIRAQPAEPTNVISWAPTEAMSASRIVSAVGRQDDISFVNGFLLDISELLDIARG